jgi:hypothetical protein
MKSWPVLVAVITIQVSCFLANLRASSLPLQLTVSIDGQESPPVDCYFEPASDGYGGKWIIGQPGYGEWEWGVGDENGDGGSIKLSGALDPDPSILFGSVAFDFGAPSAFGFTFVLPLAPLFPNPSNVSDSFSGSVTNGSAGGGVTVTALPPPVGIPVDADGVTEMQVYTLSDDGGATWKNVGLDVGVTETVSPLAPFASGLTTSYNEGPIPTIAGGPWTHMRADINFMLSGGGDFFTFNGAKILVPEPGTLLLAALCLGVFGLSRRAAVR